MKIKFEELTISEVEAFYNTLVEEIKKIDHNELILDFSEVEKIDLSGVQVLLALKKYTNNLKIKFTNIESNQLQQAIKRYNLKELLGMDHD